MNGYAIEHGIRPEYVYVYAGEYDSPVSVDAQQNGAYPYGMYAVDDGPAQDFPPNHPPSCYYPQAAEYTHTSCNYAPSSQQPIASGYHQSDVFIARAPRNFDAIGGSDGRPMGSVSSGQPGTNGSVRASQSHPTDDGYFYLRDSQAYAVRSKASGPIKGCTPTGPDGISLDGSLPGRAPLEDSSMFVEIPGEQKRFCCTYVHSNTGRPCNKIYTRKIGVERHYQIDHEGTLCECPECEKEMWPTSLGRHLKNFHGEESLLKYISKRTRKRDMSRA